MLTTQEIIDIVAKEQKIILGKNDPIFTALYINNLVLKDYIDTIEKKVNSVAETIDDINKQHQKHLEGNINNISENIAKKINEGMEQAKNQVTEKIEDAISETMTHHRRSFIVGKKTKYLLITLNIVAVAACLGTIVAFLI